MKLSVWTQGTGKGILYQELQTDVELFADTEKDTEISAALQLLAERKYSLAIR